MALSANGQRLVAAGDDQVVRVWEMPDANPQPQLQPLISFRHPSIVRAVSITNDGGVVAAAGDDNMVRLWDVTTGKVREQLAGHTGAVHAVQLSGDGTIILSGGADNHARQFFPNVIATAIADNAALNDVTFSGDGASALTVGTGNSAKQWRVTPTNVPVAAVVDPAEPAPDAEGVEATWPASRGTWLRGKLEVVREFPGATKALTSVAASRDGQYLVTSSDDAHLRLYALLDGALLAAVQSPSGIASIAISADGTTVMAGGADQIVRNYQRLKDGDGCQLALFQESLSHTAAVVDVALAFEATTLATVGADSTLQRWLAPSASPRASFTGHAGPVYGLSWRSDGELLASASGDGTVVVREVRSGEVVFRCQGHQGQVNGVAFQPAGKELASCGADRTIRIWSAELPPVVAAGEEAPAADVAAEPAPAAGAQLAIIEKDIEDTLYGVTYSRDGNYLMAGGMSKTWRQWQRGGEEPLEPTRSLLLHNHAINRVAASPSNTRFATLDTSGKLMIWNTSQGNLDFHQQLPTTKAYNFAYSPNSQEILVATSDHRVIRIILPPHAR